MYGIGAHLYMIVTCMDARIDPAAAFGIDLGDAHGTNIPPSIKVPNQFLIIFTVIRNAGASAHDALRSIIISEQLLGTQEVLLIKHTGCGMLTFKNEDAHGLVKQNLGDAAAGEIAGLDFLTFPDLDDQVRKEVAFLKETKTVPEVVAISGWVYEVETGKVRSVQ